MGRASDIGVHLFVLGSGSFPGFYTVFLPDRCWDTTGTRLLFHNQWGSLQEVVLVDTDTSQVFNVSGNRKGAWLVLDVCDDIVVAQFASLNSTPAIVSEHVQFRYS